MSADNWSNCPKCGKSEETNFTLREDFKIGTDSNGIFSVDYCCSCKECGFKFKFEKEVKTL